MLSITGEAEACRSSSHGAGCPTISSANAAPPVSSERPAATTPSHRRPLCPIDIFMPFVPPVKIPNKHLVAIDTGLTSALLTSRFLKQVYFTLLKMQASILLLCGTAITRSHPRRRVHLDDGIEVGLDRLMQLSSRDRPVDQ